MKIYEMRGSCEKSGREVMKGVVNISNSQRIRTIHVIKQANKRRVKSRANDWGGQVGGGRFLASNFAKKKVPEGK